MPHDRDTAYRLYSIDGDSVPTLACRIGQAVPDDPIKNFPKSLTPETEKWCSRRTLLRPEAENRNSGRIGLVRSKVYASRVVLLLFITFQKNVLLHFPPIYHLSVTLYSELARREFPDHRTLR